MAGDVAELGLEIDSKPIEKGAEDLDKFSRAAKEAASQTRNFETIAKRTGETVDQVRERYAKAQAALFGVAQATAEVGKASEKTNPALSATEQLFSALSQTLGSGPRGAGGALTNVMTTMLAMAPIGAGLGLAFTLAGTAASALFSAVWDGAQKTEAALKEHERLVGLVKDAYKKAGDEAGKFFKESKNVLELQIQQNLLQQRQQLASQSSSLSSGLSRPAGRTASGRQIMAPDSNFAPFNEAIVNFNKSVRDGSPDIIRYREEIARIGLAAAETNPAVAEQANKLLKASDDAGKLARQIQLAEAALAQLRGTATQEQKDLLGIKPETVRTIENARDAYDRLTTTIQRQTLQLREKNNAEALGISGGAAFLKTQELILAAQTANRPITQELLNEINQTAFAYGQANLQAAGFRTTMENRTPFEMYRDELRKLDEQLQAGAITWETYSRAAQNAGQVIRQAQSETLNRVAGTLDAISGAMDRESKKQFEISKALSLASAVVKGIESYVSSYAAGARIGGPPLGAVFAGLSLAATTAQIAKLSSMQYTGGRSSAGSASSAAAATPAAPPSQTLHIVGIDDNKRYSGQQIRELIEGINEQVKDGATLLIRSELK